MKIICEQVENYLKLFGSEMKALRQESLSFPILVRRPAKFGWLLAGWYTIPPKPCSYYLVDALELWLINHSSLVDQRNRTLDWPQSSSSKPIEK